MFLIIVQSHHQCGTVYHSKSYFKFDNWWLTTECFVQIGEWWSSFVSTGKPYYILACKLRAFKGKIKEWSKEKMSIQKVQILNQLATLDVMQREQPPYRGFPFDEL